MQTNKIKKSRYGKVVSRIIWILSSFFKQWSEYGFHIAWNGLLWWIGTYGKKPSIYSKALDKLTCYLDDYFERNYSDIISNYINVNISKRGGQNSIPLNNYPIWVFWAQGESSMPKVVRACYMRLKKYNRNVTLITKENIENYVHLPMAIYEKVSKGDISYTHLSDILRLTLLAERGGMWVDSTCFTPYAIPIEAKGMLFCSPHNSNINNAETIKDIGHWCGLGGGWRSWNLGTNEANTPLFLFCRDMIQAIAVRQKCMPCYLMVDCMIQYAYRKIKDARMMIDSTPDCNLRSADLLLLYFNKNKKYNEGEYQNLIDKDWIFKLTYKSIWKETIGCTPTFYGKLICNL